MARGWGRGGKEALRRISTGDFERSDRAYRDFPDGSRAGRSPLPQPLAPPPGMQVVRAAPSKAPSADAKRVNKDDLVAYMAKGCKDPNQFRIGTEHEKVRRPYPHPPATPPCCRRKRRCRLGF